MPWQNIFSVAAGGALGTLARYVINGIALYNSYPFATLIENLLGSLLIGLITGWFLFRHVNPQVRLALGTGFCGSFTTLSTFASDTFYLAQSHLWTAGLYVGVSLFGGLMLTGLGIIAGMKIARSGERNGSWN